MVRLTEDGLVLTLESDDEDVRGSVVGVWFGGGVDWFDGSR